MKKINSYIGENIAARQIHKPIEPCIQPVSYTHLFSLETYKLSSLDWHHSSSFGPIDQVKTNIEI